MVEYPSIKDIQHPLECGTPSEMLHYGLEYHCAEYDVLVQKCTKNIISHYGRAWLYSLGGGGGGGCSNLDARVQGSYCCGGWILGDILLAHLTYTSHMDQGDHGDIP